MARHIQLVATLEWAFLRCSEAMTFSVTLIDSGHNAGSWEYCQSRSLLMPAKLSNHSQLGPEPAPGRTLQLWSPASPLQIYWTNMILDSVLNRPVALIIVQQKTLRRATTRASFNLRIISLRAGKKDHISNFENALSEGSCWMAAESLNGRDISTLFNDLSCNPHHPSFECHLISKIEVDMASYGSKRLDPVQNL